VVGSTYCEVGSTRREVGSTRREVLVTYFLKVVVLVLGRLKNERIQMAGSRRFQPLIRYLIMLNVQGNSEFSLLRERSMHASHSGRLNIVNNVLQFPDRSELVPSVVASLRNCGHVN
jgi:hypothetical protein